jgi:hypothetical protein
MKLSEKRAEEKQKKEWIKKFAPYVNLSQEYRGYNSNLGAK